MTKRIPPTNDLALKKVLSSEGNKDILQGLVHDFFGLEIELNILGYTHFSEDGDALRIFGLYDVDRHKAFDTEYVRLAYFELDKECVGTENQRHWRDYFTTGEVADDAPAYIRKASRIIEVVNLDEREREMVDVMEKARAVYESTVATSYLDGKADGRAEGEAEGRAQGRAEGEAESRLQIARGLLSRGVDPAIVAASTGLDPETLGGLGN